MSKFRIWLILKLIGKWKVAVNMTIRNGGLENDGSAPCLMVNNKVYGAQTAIRVVR